MNEIASVFQSDLEQGEEIIWAGQPEPRLFSSYDFFLIPFGLVFFGFTIFWLLGASGFLSEPHQFSAFGLLFGIPFVSMGFYMAFGRFIAKSWKQRNTYYAVTNQRVLVFCTVPNRYLQTLSIDAIPTLNKSANSAGTGTIDFGVITFPASITANSGIDFFTASGESLAPAFYDVKDVDSIFELINGQRYK